MLLPSTPVVQVGELKIQSEYTRPATVQEAAPEVHNPILDQVQLDKIKTKQAQIKPLQAKKIPKLKQVPIPKPKVQQTASTIAKRAIKQSAVRGNTYTSGYCTWFVKAALPWVQNGWGNANMWAVNARASGYTVSNTPRVGAVAQTGEGGYGHVAVVVAVGKDTVLVKEMNFKGRYVISTRSVATSRFVYIY